jgi:predicted Zn-dependent protease
MINSVIEHNPTEPQYRGTRGHILAKLGRWQEAVPDLEASLKHKDTPEVHQRLAEAYDNLGMASLAAKHRQAADAAQAKAPPAGGAPR